MTVTSSNKGKVGFAYLPVTCAIAGFSEVSSLYVRVQGSGFRVQGSGFRVQGSGFRVQGSGCVVEGVGGRV